jgi:zinc protease
MNRRTFHVSRFTHHASHVTYVVIASLFLTLCDPAVAAGPPAQRLTLPNGARLVVSEQHAIPMVVMQILLDAGARRDPQGREGLARLTADLLTEGTKARSSMQISEATDRIGASLGSSADLDYAVLNLTVLKKDLDTGVDLLSDILLRPTFPDAEVARRREAALASMKAQEDDPGFVAQRAFTETLFRGEPYGHLVIGTLESVRKLSRADVVSFYDEYYHPAQAIITAVGDITAAEIEDRLQIALRDWRGGRAMPFQYPTVLPAPHAPVLIDKPITQATIILGHRGIARDNPDYYAVTVMNFILGGGGFTSRLMENIRTKAGLAYSVGSGFGVNKSPGSFEVVMQTKNESANDAIQRACTEIKRMRAELVGDDELNEAKLYLTGSFPLRFDTNAKIAGFFAQVEFFNLGADYADTYAQRINAVTKDEVLRVAQQYLHPDQLLLVVAGNLSQAKISPTVPCAM